MKFSRKALLVCLGAFAAAQAQAMAQNNSGGDTNSFYVGGSYVRAMYNIDEQEQNKFAMANLPANSTAKGTFQSEDNGYEIHVGYMFVPNFGVEIGYSDFGKFVQTLEVSNGATPAVMSKTMYNIATTAFTASLIGAYQLEGGLSIFGRLSGMYTTTKPTFETTPAGAAGSIPATVYTKSEYNKFVPGLGIGAAFNINDQFRIRAEGNYWYQPADNTMIAVKDLKNIVIGADVSFY
ncbi:outer membrane beta-barrel protein [Candidatus Ichthyocystis hellenicum]|uniref:outer membrane beta-barrel protein n=1 Tax=Candidatus Ichthyocystis hellenicum TaxID=1561003 RepID=UPI000B84E385|nr:outer membrane beta-barrel protein [Candidatus Ichthyocystis hellenicum]